MPSARKRDARSPMPRTAGRAAPGTNRPGKNRRLWLAAGVGTAVILGVVLALRSLTSFTAGGRQADLRPIRNQNVLLITIDTLRADALHSYGGRAATPTLDRLAQEGVRFDFAHAHAAV